MNKIWLIDISFLFKLIAALISKIRVSNTGDGDWRSAPMEEAESGQMYEDRLNWRLISIGSLQQTFTTLKQLLGSEACWRSWLSLHVWSCTWFPLLPVPSQKCQSVIFCCSVTAKYSCAQTGKCSNIEITVICSVCREKGSPTSHTHTNLCKKIFFGQMVASLQAIFCFL